MRLLRDAQYMENGARKSFANLCKSQCTNLGTLHIGTPINHDHAPCLVVSDMFSWMADDEVWSQRAHAGAAVVPVFGAFSGGHGWLALCEARRIEVE